MRSVCNSKTFNKFQTFEGGQCFSTDLKTHKLINSYWLASAEGLSNQSSTLLIQHIVFHLVYLKIKDRGRCTITEGLHFLKNVIFEFIYNIGFCFLQVNMLVMPCLIEQTVKNTSSFHSLQYDKFTVRLKPQMMVQRWVNNNN